MKRAMFFLLISLLTAAPVLAQGSPKAVADGFFAAYTRAMADASGEWMKTLMTSQSDHIEKPLHDYLIRLANGNPEKNEPFLDFDPFSNSQVGIESYAVGKPSMKGGLAYVPVSIAYPGVPGPKKVRLHLIMRQAGQGDWKLANVAYPAESGMKPWDLMGYLRDSFK